jgi:hypothetical protein
VVAKCTADRRRGQARQPARDVAKRSGLTAPEDRRTISHRDEPALLSDGDGQRENEPDETRKVGKQSGGDGAVPSQAEIQCECAFTYMNAVLRKNLTDTVAIDANDGDIASDTGGALNDRKDRARFCRTNATCTSGVSDPRFSGRQTSKGGWQGGSLTPQMSASCSRQPLTVTRAAQSAARRHRAEPAECERHRRIAAPRA